jgi:hypothetical protein
VATGRCNHARVGREQCSLSKSNSRAREHFEQSSRDVLRSFCRHRSEHPDQSLPVYGTELVQRHLPSFTLKSHRYPRGVRAPDCSHGSNDDGPQMLVHFIGGDDETRTRLLNLSPLCGIGDYQPDFIPLRPTYHRHSGAKGEEQVASPAYGRH